MSALELYYGNAKSSSTAFNVPIRLPDGRFIGADGWRESYPPKASGFIFIKGNQIDRYATAELLNS